MEVDELSSENMAHAVDVCGVCPVRIVDASEGYALLLALQCCVHHMR